LTIFSILCNIMGCWEFAILLVVWGMYMYALVEIKGKQYKAEKGGLLKVDRLDREKGDKLEFSSVMLTSDNGRVKIGSPYLSGVKVTGILEDTKKDKKVVVYKFKKRKGYRNKRGHRQQYSYVRIQAISGVKKDS